MRRARPYILLVLVIAVLLPATLLFRRHLQKQNKINTALWALVLHKNDHSKLQTAVSELATFGSAAYPNLARAFRGEYTLIDRAYDLAGRKLPRPLSSYFPARPSRAELRRAIAITLYDLGPAASRALLNEIELGLQQFDDYEGMKLLCALNWSIPESPRAVQILSNYLAHPKPGKLLFGMRDARDVWPHVPHLALLLRPWLHYLDTTSEAAQALGLMGTDAAFAVPLLIEIARTGLIPDPTFHSRYRQGGSVSATLRSADRQISTTDINRAAAIEALGNIGVATPQVLEVLKHALTLPSDRLRNEAALAFGALGPKAVPALDFFLANIDRENSSVLHHQLRALTEIGTNASTAVPLLLELSQNHAFSILGYLNRVPSASPTGLRDTWLWRNEPQPGMIPAALALTQIDLHAARDRIDVLALALRHSVPAKILPTLRGFKSELIPQLEPHLHVGEPLGTLRPPFGPLGMPIVRIVLAQNILTLDPENQPARSLLEAAMSSADPTMRSIAAMRYHTATGDTNKTLPIVTEALQHVKTIDDQLLISIISEFGPDAKSLRPHLQPFLNHPDQFIRSAAGKAIRSIMK